MGYYEKQLKSLKGDISVKFVDGFGDSSKWLSINVESVDVLIGYLKGLKREIKKGK